MKQFTKVFISFLLILAAISVGCGKKETSSTPEYVVGAYLWHSHVGEEPIDGDCVTHLYYGFGNVNDSLTGVDILSPDKFEYVASLKDSFPHLKVLISIGGGGNSKFSNMAADSLKRLAFAADINRIIAESGIDGVDFDWETPGNKYGVPEDTINFVKMIRDVRNAIGDDKLLTIAWGGGAGRLNGTAVLPYVDYFNVMAYDMGGYRKHHTSLHRSPLTGWHSIDETVSLYNARGIPNDKIVLGMGFYGRGDEERMPQFINYKELSPYYDDLTLEWDSIALVPYLMNADSALVLAFDNPRSLAIKCDYIKEQGLRGGMYWKYSADDSVGTLRHTVARCLLGK